MQITHHDLVTSLYDEWWIEAGMVGFVPASKAYRDDRRAVEICIADIGPLDQKRRDRGVFKDDEDHGITARERVIKILRGFRMDVDIPPVAIVEGSSGYGHPYRLTDGTHRLYCAIAAGFTHVPTIKGFSFDTQLLP